MGKRREKGRGKRREKGRGKERGKGTGNGRGKERGKGTGKGSSLKRKRIEEWEMGYEISREGSEMNLNTQGESCGGELGILE